MSAKELQFSIDARAFKALIKAAVAHNGLAAEKPKQPPKKR